MTASDFKPLTTALQTEATETQAEMQEAQAQAQPPLLLLQLPPALSIKRATTKETTKETMAAKAVAKEATKEVTKESTKEATKPRRLQPTMAAVTGRGLLEEDNSPAKVVDADKDSVIGTDSKTGPTLNRHGSGLRSEGSERKEPLTAQGFDSGGDTS